MEFLLTKIIIQSKYTTGTKFPNFGFYNAIFPIAVIATPVEKRQSKIIPVLGGAK